MLKEYYEQFSVNKLDNLDKVDTFLQRHKLLKLNQEVECLNGPASKEIILKNIHKENRPMWLHWWILPNIYRRISTIFSQCLPKKQKRRELASYNMLLQSPTPQLQSLVYTHPLHPGLITHQCSVALDPQVCTVPLENLDVVKPPILDLSLPWASKDQTLHSWDVASLLLPCVKE